MVGEVWLASGQSNLEFTMQMIGGVNLDSAKAANHPDLRIMNYRGSGKWNPCTPATALAFSATGYYFGRDLRKALKVPVGIVSSAVGGNRIGAVDGPGHLGRRSLAGQPTISGSGNTGSCMKSMMVSWW